MTVENAVRVVAGTFVLAGVTLGHFVHPGFYLLDVFVGLNLIQSAFTGFCPAAMIFQRMGLKATG